MEQYYLLLIYNMTSLTLVQTHNRKKTNGINSIIIKFVF